MKATLSQEVKGQLAKSDGGKSGELLCNMSIGHQQTVGLWCIFLLCDTILHLPVSILHDLLHSNSLVLPPPCLTDPLSATLSKSFILEGVVPILTCAISL